MELETIGSTVPIRDLLNSAVLRKVLQSDLLERRCRNSRLLCHHLIAFVNFHLGPENFFFFNTFSIVIIATWFQLALLLSNALRICTCAVTVRSISHYYCMRSRDGRDFIIHHSAFLILKANRNNNRCTRIINFSIDFTKPFWYFLLPHMVNQGYITNQQTIKMYYNYVWL